MSGRHALQEPWGDEPHEAASPDPAVPGASIRVLAGSPTPEELAAVTAVLAALEAEESAAAARRTVPRGQSGWQESQRSLRVPLHPGPGRWSRSAG